MKEPATSFQSPAFSKKCLKCLSYSTLVFDQISFWKGLGFKRNKHKCNLHYAAMLMMASQILKSAGFTKTQVLIFWEWNILSSNEKIH